MSPLAMSSPRCAVCHGVGLLPRGSVCPCVHRRMERERRRLDQWERLWLDATSHPEWFGQPPLPRSMWFAFGWRRDEVFS